MFLLLVSVQPIFSVLERGQDLFFKLYVFPHVSLLHLFLM